MTVKPLAARRRSPRHVLTAVAVAVAGNAALAYLVIGGFVFRH